MRYNKKKVCYFLYLSVLGSYSIIRQGFDPQEYVGNDPEPDFDLTRPGKQKKVNEHRR
jgi:hypothetical protein